MQLRIEMKHIDILNHKELCSGCGACIDRCPKQCISFKEDGEGFLYPVVNEGACIDCGLCLKICPFIRENYNRSKSSFVLPKIYAAKHKVNEIRRFSTSGGVFTALSDYVLANNGVVCGAIFDSQTQTVKHIIATTYRERDRMKGSKYVQSDLKNIFLKLKFLLLKKVLVLFSGTPCQTAGLYAYLGKDYENLYVIDILCHSVPSPLILGDILKQYTLHADDISFRDKSIGWRDSYNFCIKYEDGKVAADSTYLSLFFKGLINRPSCYNCRFANIKRPSDITIGDYWNIKNVDASFEDALGVSCILVNSEKGNSLLSFVEDKLFIIETSLKPALQICMQHPITCPSARKFFWKDYYEKGINYVVNEYGHYTIWENIKANILAPISRKTGVSSLLRVLKNTIKK